ncbi:hypothetical protein E3P94_02359 [Wallemia ichthyophaga]|nr:hypothetical protein E3P95_02302 [Wallemia ichthyophaga]TIB00045.1 hypothetical protein E3P94_02359 [Wallemia ichthyophaga]
MGNPRNARKSGRRTNNVIDDTKDYERDLKTQVDSMGLYTVDTPTDGSCMFHAISDQMYGDNKFHLELRNSTCNYLEENEDLYAGFIEDDQTYSQHVDNMRDPTTYGGHLELSALANITRHSIKVIQPNLIYVVTADNTLPPNLYVAYHNWEHYSSVRNKKGPHKGPPMVQEQIGVTENVSNYHNDQNQDVMNQVMRCIPADLQAIAQEERIVEILADFDNNWENAVEYILEYREVTIDHLGDRSSKAAEIETDKASKSPKRELEESSGEDKGDQTVKKTNRREKKAQKKQNKSDKRRVTRSMAREDKEEDIHHNHAPSSVKSGSRGDKGENDVADSASPNKTRRKKYAPELLVIVRPPPHISNNPMNLQIQLVTPKSNRQSTASDGDLSRSSSIHSDHSLGQVSNLSLHSTTSQITSGGRKLIPLYNLQYHNVLTTAITDAGTDARIARFTKRGLDIQNLINLETEGVLDDSLSTTSTKKFSLDNLFKLTKDKGSALDKTPNQEEYTWNVKRVMKGNDEIIEDDALRFLWQKKTDSTPTSGDNSRRSSISHSQSSRPNSKPNSKPNSTIDTDIDREDDETPWKFYALSKHFERVHLGTIHPAPHHPRIVGQLKVPFPLPSVQLPNTNINLSPEDLKDILSCTGLWLVIKEEFGGLDKRRKGDGWRIT